MLSFPNSNHTSLFFTVILKVKLILAFQPREKGRMRFHRLQNVQIALDYLKQRHVSQSK